MNQELKPCPFCGDPMRERGGLIQHVEQTEGCPIRQEAWDSGQIDRWNRRADALEGGVTVKPLEWEERHELRHLAMTETYWRAQTAFDWGYRVKKTAGCYAVHGMEGVHTSLSDAKAAAQADYERRVLSALSAPAQRVEEGWKLVPVEPTGAMLSAGTLAGVSAAPDPWCPAAYRAMFAASPATAPHAGVDALAALAEHTNWELTCGPVDGDLTTLEWQVHQRNGGVNDREWTRLSIGETPEEALRAALEDRT